MILRQGGVALSFFRIVEMTINEKMIQPLAKIVEGEPRSILHTERERMSAKDKGTYNEKWGKIVNTLFEMSKNRDKGMMLGDLEKLFISIGSAYDINDKIAVLIKDAVNGLLTETGQQMILAEHYLEDALSGENRSKYRNPPAHCRYLTYDVACECRDFTCDLLFTLNSLIRK